LVEVLVRILRRQYDDNVSSVKIILMPFTRKQTAGVGVLLVLLIALPVGMYLVSNPQVFSPKAASDSTVDLSLEPMSITVDINEEFPVDINIDSKGASISAAQIKVNYDSESLEAKNVEIKDFLPVSLVPPAISGGSVSIIQGVNPGAVKTGIGTIARITFKALKIATGSAIVIDPVSQIAIADRDNNAAGELGNALVNISCGVISAPTITIPLNPVPGNQTISWGTVEGASKYSVEIHDLKNSLVCAAGREDLCQETQANSVNYDFKKGHKYQVKVQAENSCGSSAEDMKQVLLPFDGDVDKNGIVDIYDFNVVVRDFNRPSSAGADINNNGIVDIFDYNFVVRDFNKSFTNP
jgi:hypothetical protein